MKIVLLGFFFHVNRVIFKTRLNSQLKLENTKTYPYAKMKSDIQLKKPEGDTPMERYKKHRRESRNS